MQWLQRLNEIEKQIMRTVPTQGAVKHALKTNSDDMWQKINKAYTNAQKESETLLSSLKNETDKDLHPYIDTIYQHLHVVRNAQIQKCLPLLEDSESTEAKKLLDSLRSQIKKVPTIESEKLPEDLKKLVANASEKGFDRASYEALLPYAMLMHSTEKVGVAQEHAYKLSTLFADRNEALNYLLRYQKNHPNRTQLMHDACLFVFTTDDCNINTINTWRQLTLKHKNQENFRNLLPHAGKIEALIRTDTKKNKPNNVDIKKLNAEISKLNNEWKELGKRKSTLSKKENDRYNELTKLISSKRVELSEAYAGTPFDESSSLEMLRAYYERYKTQVSATHAEFIDSGMTSKDYERFLRIKRVDDIKKFPPFTLDGAKYGYPGVYVTKAPILEEKWASLMARLGKKVGCCQSISGEAGEPCARHLLESPEGAGFVIEAGDFNNPDPYDELYSGSWAWRSKKGRIVFDSVEPDRKIRAKVSEPTIHLMRAAGYEMVKRGDTDKVVCGAFSGISKQVGVEDFFDSVTEEFIDYNGYNDSRVQLTIYDQVRPYYLYDLETFANTETHALLDKILLDKQPLEASKGFTEMLNWAIVKRCVPLLDKIKRSAGDRINEVNDHIKRVNNCIVALKQGDLDKFLELATPGPLYNILGENRDSALMAAVKAGHTESVQLLINAGADINQRDRYGNSAFFKAIESGSAETVQVFIDAGLDVNQKNKHGHTPIWTAVRGDHAKTMQTLIKAGAEHDLDRLLQSAAGSGKTKTAQALINLGASLEASSSDESLLESAATTGYNTQMFTLLKEAGASYDKDKLLSSAALSGTSETVKMLLDDGANPNVRGEYGATPLLDAVQRESEWRGSKEIFELLIEAKADPNIRDTGVRSLANTPLIEAVRKRDLDYVQKLIKAGADVNMPNKFGATALHEASRLDEDFDDAYEIVEALINAGANLNKQDNFGNTALHEAVSRRNMKVIKLLINKGAELFLKNHEGQRGQSPFRLANVLKNKTNNPKNKTEFVEIRTLLNKGLSAQKKSQAAQSGFFKTSTLTLGKIDQCLTSDNAEGLIKLLHDTHSPIDPWITDSDGNECTVLMHACELGALNTIEALIDKGADPRKTDTDGDTAAAYAIDSDDTNDTAILELLKNKGVDLNLPNFKGETVLDRAKEFGNEEAETYLSDIQGRPTLAR